MTEDVIVRVDGVLLDHQRSRFLVRGLHAYRRRLAVDLDLKIIATITLSPSRGIDPYIGVLGNRRYYTLQ
jgi:hypothetical protein